MHDGPAARGALLTGRLMERLRRLFSLADLVAGALVLALGVFTLYEASGYARGSMANIGPGFFPGLLGMLLVACGIGIILVEGTRDRSAALPRPEIRAALATVAALGLFALLIERAGLAPAVMATTYAASYATTTVTPLFRFVTASGVTIVCVLVFPIALGLPMRIVTW
ncbi:MAG: tripartite tricarboxylate transporter TctB family protein [Rhodobacteraceae bacterium]|nr:tripartite tricarboxylate transporter TctB family protein [Paracoccaceae bacterium]